MRGFLKIKKAIDIESKLVNSSKELKHVGGLRSGHLYSSGGMASRGAAT